MNFDFEISRVDLFNLKVIFSSSNINTTWLITKPSETESIVLDIREMHIEHSTDCVYDSLTIYDGETFFVYCHSSHSYLCIIYISLLFVFLYEVVHYFCLYPAVISNDTR